MLIVGEGIEGFGVGFDGFVRFVDGDVVVAEMGGHGGKDEGRVEHGGGALAVGGGAEPVECGAVAFFGAGEGEVSAEFGGEDFEGEEGAAPVVVFADGGCGDAAFGHGFTVEAEGFDGLGGFFDVFGFEKGFGIEGDSHAIDPPVEERVFAKGFCFFRSGEGGEGFGGVTGSVAAHEDASGEGFGIPEEESGARGGGAVGIEGGSGDFFSGSDGVVEVAF